MDSRALVARNIRLIRVAKGLSQEALAHEAGIDRSYMSRLERGLENPTVALLDKLAKALEAQIVALFAPIGASRSPENLKPGRKGRRPTGRRTAQNSR